MFVSLPSTGKGDIKLDFGIRVGGAGLLDHLIVDLL